MSKLLGEWVTILPVILKPRRRRAAGYVVLTVFDERGNLLAKTKHRVRRATEEIARQLAEHKKFEWETKGANVTIDPPVIEDL